MVKLLSKFALLLAASAWACAPVQADWITKTAKTEKPVRAAKSEKPAAPKLPPMRMAKPALWKLSDADTTIYLFGTIHVLPDRIDWYRGKIETAMRESDSLMTEIEGDDPALVQSVVMRTAMLPKGQTLHQMLSPEDVTLLDAILEQYKIPVAAIDPYEPWFAAIVLADYPLVRENFKAENGVEAQLGAKSKALSQTHEGLETIEFQLGIFDRLPRKIQLKYLHEVMIGVPGIRKELLKLVDFWSKGNVDDLAKLVNEDEQIPEMAQVLIYGRNQSWAEWIRRRMAKPGKVFIAVGAGHLAGTGSVQAYLAKMKIYATRVQ